MIVVSDSGPLISLIRVLFLPMLFHLPVYKICARYHLEYPSIFMPGEFFLFQPSPFLQVRLFCLSVQYFLPKIHRKAIISFMLRMF